MNIQIDKLFHCPCNWRFKSIWLQNEDFFSFIKIKIDLYFEINTDQTGACTRWEAFKAYIRGEIISYTSSKTKQQKAEMRDLEKQIKKLENDLDQGNDPLKHKELLFLRSKYNELSTDRAAKSLLWQRYYDQGEKAGKLLAWRIRKLQTERAINSIRTSNGDLTVDPQEINSTFREFYEQLYKSEIPPTSLERDAFLDSLAFPVLSEEAKQNLDNHLTEEEISAAIQSINTNRAPEPDGLTIEFYKAFQKQLLTPLMAMYKESYNKETLPPTLRR